GPLRVDALYADLVPIPPFAPALRHADGLCGGRDRPVPAHARPGGRISPPALRSLPLGDLLYETDLILPAAGPAVAGRVRAAGGHNARMAADPAGHRRGDGAEQLHAA